jgi:hypothetical protein
MKYIITESQYSEILKSLKLIIFRYWDKMGASLDKDFLNFFKSVHEKPSSEFRPVKEFHDLPDDAIIFLYKALLEYRGEEKNLDIVRNLIKGVHYLEGEECEGVYDFGFRIKELNFNYWDDHLYMDVEIIIDGENNVIKDNVAMREIEFCLKSYFAVKIFTSTGVLIKIDRITTN